jgi:hypothetical protein
MIKKENIIMAKMLTLEDYEITRDGQVINKHTGKILKGQPNGKGYLRVSIGKKLNFIHRLVAEKYIPNPNNYPQVNHKDGNKLNNCVENLEWVTNLDNRKHAVKEGLHLSGEACSWSRLNWEKVEYIRNHPEISSKEFSEKYQVAVRTIRDVREFKTWKIKNDRNS